MIYIYSLFTFRPATIFAGVNCSVGKGCSGALFKNQVPNNVHDYG